MSKFKPSKNKSYSDLVKENKKLKDKLKAYETISRSVYELVNINSLSEWNDSYSYGEGVESINVLKTLVEATQDITSPWNYYDWDSWVKQFNPEDFEE